MRQILFYIMILSFFSSCVNIEFKNPQPADKINLEEFPSTLIGNYKLLTDTFKIDKTSIHIPVQLFEDRTEPKKYTISDSVILRYFKKEYFLNVKSKNNQWDVFTLRINRDENILVKSTSSFYFIVENDSLVSNHEFERENELKKLMRDNNYPAVKNSYSIDPTRKELRLLMRKNLFQKLIELERVE